MVKISQRLRDYTTPSIVEEVLKGRVNLISSAFVWDYTPQGYSYWNNKCYGGGSSLSREDINFLRRLIGKSPEDTEEDIESDA